MRDRKRWLVLLMAFVALAAIAAGCGSDDDEAAEAPPPPAAEPPPPAPEPPPPAPEPEPEPPPPPPEPEPPAPPPEPLEPLPVSCNGSIGFIGPITGDAAFIGTEQLNWTRLAVDIFNEENGTEFVLVEGDSMLDPAEGSLVATQFLSDDNIIATVGPAGSQVVQAAIPILDGEMVFISGSATVNELTADSTTFYRTVGLNRNQARDAARFLSETLGVASVMVVDDQESYSTGLADDITLVLEEAGVAVTRESVSQDAADFSALVSKIEEDVVYLPWQLANKAQVFADQMAEQGIEATIVGADGLDSGDFTPDGAYITRFAPDVTAFDDTATVAVVERYLDEYGEFATVFGPPSYVATQVIAEAMKFVCDVGSAPNREGVMAAVRGTSLEGSVLGRPITFQGSGDLADAPFFFIWQHQGGELVFVGQ